MTEWRKLLQIRRSRLGRRDIFRLAGNAILAGTGLARAADREIATAVWVSYFREKNVWGYFDKHSVTPGDSLDLMLSTGPDRERITGHVELFRIEPLSVSGRQAEVWKSQSLTVSNQPVLRTAPAIGLHWSLSSRIDTSGWRPGYYSADFVDDVTGVRDLQIAQMVVLNPEQSGRILL
jgi:hypothetical protein